MKKLIEKIVFNVGRAVGYIGGLINEFFNKES